MKLRSIWHSDATTRYDGWQTIVILYHQVTVAQHCFSCEWSFIIIIISGLHYYECTVQLATSRAWFWAILTASVHVTLWYSRSFRTVFINVIRGWLGGLFQSSGESAVRTFLASALSSNRATAMCPNRERCRAWIDEVRRGWPLVHITLVLETNWYH